MLGWDFNTAFTIDNKLHRLLCISPTWNLNSPESNYMWCARDHYYHYPYMSTSSKIILQWQIYSFGLQAIISMYYLKYCAQHLPLPSPIRQVVQYFGSEGLSPGLLTKKQIFTTWRIDNETAWYIYFNWNEKTKTCFTVHETTNSTLPKHLKEYRLLRRSPLMYQRLSFLATNPPQLWIYLQKFTTYKIRLFNFCFGACISSSWNVI